jgi:hypothetical protein
VSSELAGFLVGFQSQSHPAEAYIHFVGIHPGEAGPDGIAVAAGYDGDGQDRVRFVKRLAP